MSILPVDLDPDALKLGAPITSSKKFVIDNPNVALVEPSYTVEEAIYMLSSDKITCTNSLISAPKIFLKSPSVLHAQNCKFDGKVIYLSDPSTCTLYQDDPFVAVHCPNYIDDL